MTENETDSFDFGTMLDELKRMVRKDCAECGQVFRGLPEQELCTECQYKQDNPEARDMYWIWSRNGRGGSWGIAAYWPDDEPLPDPGAVVTVHRKDGSASTVIIKEVEGLRYLPTGRAQLRCMVE